LSSLQFLVVMVALLWYLTASLTLYGYHLWQFWKLLVALYLVLLRGHAAAVQKACG
jgi:hypothetical protein